MFSIKLDVFHTGTGTLHLYSKAADEYNYTVLY